MNWLLLTALQLLAAAAAAAAAGGLLLLMVYVPWQRLRRSALARRITELRGEHAELLRLVEGADDLRAAADAMTLEREQLEQDIGRLKPEVDELKQQREAAEAAVGAAAARVELMRETFKEMWGDYQEFRPRIPARVRSLEKMNHWRAYEDPG